MNKIIIKKFGGTSLTDLNRVANLIKNDIEKGYNVIAVVSAAAGFTDQMAFQARQISNLNCRQELSEYDVLLSAGEQVSCGLLAITLLSIGVNAKSWLAWQLPILTDNFYSESKIKKIKIDHIKRSFAEGYTTAIIAGFQGIYDDRITTFGRGGSDISAIAFAVVFGIRTCEIFTDIDGIYTADPKIIPRARKLKSISYNEILEMSSSGAKILHNRSVQLAMKHNIKVQVLSTFEKGEGTTVLHEKDVLERYLITGITYSTHEALVTFTNFVNTMDTLRDIARANVKVDMIHGSSFLISKFDVDLMTKLLNKNENYVVNNNIAKISIIGIGVMSNTEVMYRTLKVLSEKKIEILAITMSEIKISIVVQKKHAEALIRDLHTEYELDV
ncbi:aspartate kinase [Wolbachia endosymbiont of Trichogramma pretiosum]|uniref:aspartate kinase n=1 Tax=Wolbachia endosymbiont of Trichogramma pretiosum TaxID=125593 RepID=UPI000837F955|nr:aspartate kinase [Wolbachia endosymbiont of Trichogramma pretiosum]OCA06705.1 aspartate kinase domain protein [Wolbachia endosymbiont of Trichogramma pretiosum]